MGQKLDDIYGIDETNLASEVSSQALSAKALRAWEGSPTGESGSEGNSDSRVVNKGEVVVKAQGQSGDGRARTAGNHGKQG